MPATEEARNARRLKMALSWNMVIPNAAGPHRGDGLRDSPGRPVHKFSEKSLDCQSLVKIEQNMTHNNPAGQSRRVQVRGRKEVLPANPCWRCRSVSGKSRGLPQQAAVEHGELAWTRQASGTAPKGQRQFFVDRSVRLLPDNPCQVAGAIEKRRLIEQHQRLQGGIRLAAANGAGLSIGSVEDGKRGIEL